MKKTSALIIIIISAFLIFGWATTARADLDPEFDPANIISDEELLDYSSLDKDGIQNFLVSHNSFLSTYRTINAHGTPDKSAAEIIYDASHQNYDCSGVTLGPNPTENDKKANCRIITTVNPKLLLVLLQKEQSLIEDPSPSQTSLDWAVGYGCPDSVACNPYYKGFGKQMNSASLQFLAYINEQNRYPYKAGQTYDFTNANNPISGTGTISVTPKNRATAALYNYTPHVFNGNYNFFRLWKKYFPKVTKIYSDGSLLQIEGQAGVWLIEDGKKRAFQSFGALTSRFNPKKIIKVDASILVNYPVGAPIKFPNYSLVKDEKNGIFLLVDNEKKPITSMTAFKKIGFNTAEIVPATSDDLVNYKTGKAITATSTYPTGALLQDRKTGGVYYVENGLKTAIPDKSFLTAKFSDRKIIKTDSTELNRYQNTEPMMYKDGELLKSNNSGAVYLIDKGKKRPFTSGEIFEKMGYQWTNVITVSPQFLYKYPLGEAVTFDTNTPSS